MTQKEFYEMKKRYYIEMQEELLRVQCDGEDLGYIYCGIVDFNYSDIYFEIKTTSSDDCRIIHHYFICKNVDELKKAITWIVNDTKFYEATAFVKGKPYVTFRCQKDIDLYFDYYYK